MKSIKYSSYISPYIIWGRLLLMTAIIVGLMLMAAVIFNLIVVPFAVPVGLDTEAKTMPPIINDDAMQYGPAEHEDTTPLVFTGVENDGRLPLTMPVRTP